MSVGKYSPTVMYSYNFDPDWWKKNSVKGEEFDKDGYDKFGFDENGKDREGNTLKQYYTMQRKNGRNHEGKGCYIYCYPLYEEIYLKWNMKLAAGRWCNL